MRKFKVGDCINLNLAEQPCGKYVAVVVADDGDHYSCQYLNDDRCLDVYNNPAMKTRLEDATNIEDFGVVIRAKAGVYWCEQRSESTATYRDGKPRKWQEFGGPTEYRARPELAELLWPF
jgi:hypothetical protein